mmetsp:Transcript_22010/g.74625  ORF Transcript_22010/g.74625 Transcript_22010/m.74625 type:complete len:210 (+) Transcript_22010:1496-2125(+)
MPLRLHHLQLRRLASQAGPAQVVDVLRAVRVALHELLGRLRRRARVEGVFHGVRRTPLGLPGPRPRLVPRRDARREQGRVRTHGAAVDVAGVVDDVLRRNFASPGLEQAGLHRRLSQEAQDVLRQAALDEDVALDVEGPQRRRVERGRHGGAASRRDFADARLEGEVRNPRELKLGGNVRGVLQRQQGLVRLLDSARAEAQRFRRAPDR